MTDTTILDTINNAFTAIQDGKIYRSIIDDTEKTLIQAALKRSAGNQIHASKVLGINRNTLRTKIKKLNIDMEKFKNG